jgi:prephenate dehydrogenase
VDSKGERVRLAIVGLGLIGGSIARAVRAPGGDDGRWSISGWSPSGRSVDEARGADILDDAPPSLAEAVAGADLVVVAAPPLASLGVLDQLADIDLATIAPGTVVTDVASTKTTIVARAVERGLPFVGGHPMAGSDRSGFGAGRGDLFHDRPWVVVSSPGASDEAIDRVERLARRCRAHPIRMSPDEHDRAVAGVSHLPLLLSAALVEAVASASDRETALALAASGWRDMTRLAGGDVEMAVGIAATNPRRIAERARDLRTVLDRWIVDLEREPGPDESRLREAFEAARQTATD